MIEIIQAKILYFLYSILVQLFLLHFPNLFIHFFILQLIYYTSPLIKIYQFIFLKSLSIQLSSLILFSIQYLFSFINLLYIYITFIYLNKLALANQNITTMNKQQSDFYSPLLPKKDVVAEVQEAYHKYNLFLQRYYSLALIKAAVAIALISIVCASKIIQPNDLNLPHIFVLTELMWVISSFYIRSSFSPSFDEMAKRVKVSVSVSVAPFFISSYFFVNDETFFEKKVLFIIWVLQIILYLCILTALLSILLTVKGLQLGIKKIAAMEKYKLKSTKVGRMSFNQKSKKDIILQAVNLNAKKIQTLVVKSDNILDSKSSL